MPATKAWRRAILALALGISLLGCVYGQESPAKEGGASETEQSDPWIGWKWANFAILAVGLGYIMAKALPPLFQSRAKEIHDAIADAKRVKDEAQAAAQAMETRRTNIQKEIGDLRNTARQEMAAEGERIKRETENHLEKIRGQATQEMTLMTRVARGELRKYSAQLAVDLAEQRIRSRVSKEDQNRLMDDFLRDLGSPKPPRVGA